MLWRFDLQGKLDVSVSGDVMLSGKALQPFDIIIRKGVDKPGVQIATSAAV